MNGSIIINAITCLVLICMKNLVATVFFSCTWMSKCHWVWQYNIIILAFLLQCTFAQNMIQELLVPIWQNKEKTDFPVPHILKVKISRSDDFCSHSQWQTDMFFLLTCPGESETGYSFTKAWYGNIHSQTQSGIHNWYVSFNNFAKID